MARYLAYTSPARGHLYPIVATLLELRDRGHDVHVRTLASELDALRALGLHAEPIAAAIEAAPLRDFEASSPEEALGKALATFADRAQHEVPDLQRAIDDVAPDALLIDITTVGAAALAEAGSLPWAQTIPLFQRFSPDPSIPSTVTRVPFGIVPEPGLAVINGPRAQLDLRPLAGPEEMWRAPLHLYYTARPFELDLAFPPSFRFVGPGVWEPPAPEPAWLADVDAPLVLVSVSSEHQHDAALIQTALDALRDENVVIAASTAAHDPIGFDAPGQRARRALAATRPAARQGRLHDLPRRHGHSPENARRRRARMRRPVRPRPVRGRRTRRGRRRRHLSRARRAQRPGTTRGCRPSTRHAPRRRVRRRRLRTGRRRHGSSLGAGIPTHPGADAVIHHDRLGNAS